jgi:hypothetical protein
MILIHLNNSLLLNIMIDYLSVSASIIFIVGIFMYHCIPECQSCKVNIPETIIRGHILSFLSPKNRLYINKSTNKDAVIALRREFVLTHYPHDILKALGGIERCVNNYRFMDGSSQALDTRDHHNRVKVEDLSGDSNVYLGIDRLNRPFAILRYWVGPTDDYDTDGDYDTEQHKSLKSPEPVVATMFQRYTVSSPYLHAVLSANYMTTWCLGTSYRSHYMPGDNLINKATLERIGQLLQGQTVIVKGWRSQGLVLGITEGLVSSI